MENPIQKEELFKKDAKDIVDTIFDNRLFKEDITRDNMNGFEDLITFLLQSKFNSRWKAEKFFEQISKVK